MERPETQLRPAEPDFPELTGRIALQVTPAIPPGWLRCEMLERHDVLRRAPGPLGAIVLEVGSGPHAISTTPRWGWSRRVGYRLGPKRARRDLINY